MHADGVWQACNTIPQSVHLPAPDTTKCTEILHCVCRALSMACRASAFSYSVLRKAQVLTFTQTACGKRAVPSRRALTCQNPDATSLCLPCAQHGMPRLGILLPHLAALIHLLLPNRHSRLQLIDGPCARLQRGHLSAFASVLSTAPQSSTWHVRMTCLRATPTCLATLAHLLHQNR